LRHPTGPCNNRECFIFHIRQIVRSPHAREAFAQIWDGTQTSRSSFTLQDRRLMQRTPDFPREVSIERSRRWLDEYPFEAMFDEDARVGKALYCSWLTHAMHCAWTNTTVFSQFAAALEMVQDMDDDSTHLLILAVVKRVIRQLAVKCYLLQFGPWRSSQRRPVFPFSPPQGFDQKRGEMVQLGDWTEQNILGGILTWTDGQVSLRAAVSRGGAERPLPHPSELPLAPWLT